MIMNWFEIVVIWFLTVLCNRQSEKDMLSLSGCREKQTPVFGDRNCMFFLSLIEVNFVAN